MIYDSLAALASNFLYLLARVAPFFLLATLAAAVLSYASPRWGSRLLGQGNRSVYVASLLAAILPGCSCATIPMTEGLRRQGSPLGTLTAFLMMSPLLAPHTLILTWGMLGWDFAIGRLVLPFVFIVPLGILLNRYHGRPGWNMPLPVSGGADDAQPCGCGDSAQPSTSSWQLFVSEFAGVLLRIGKPFLLGLLLAAGLTVLLPEDAIPQAIGRSAPFAFLVAALVGIPIYVCEGEEVPLTYAALRLGLGPGPAFTFLLGSVGTCLPTIVMSQRIIGRRATLVYVAAWLIFAIGSGLLFGLAAT